MATEAEFDQWCDEVEDIVSRRIGRDIDYEDKAKWVYSFYFNQGLTHQQAADEFYQFIHDPARNRRKEQKSFGESRAIE